MKSIRKLLYKLLGLKNYLRVVSWIYLRLAGTGLIKKKYPELFFLKNIVKSGYCCIDIGANVGYYSYFLAKLVGMDGLLIAVEPVPLFAEIWKKNVPLNRGNVKLLQYALGGEDKEITMAMPFVDNVVHHGMTHVMNAGEDIPAETFPARMVIPDFLFAGTGKIDFIKCDVEGYEYYVFSNFRKCLARHLPLVQCELGSANRDKVFELFTSLGYTAGILKDDKITPVTETQKSTWNNDFYFFIEGKHVGLVCG